MKRQEAFGDGTDRKLEVRSTRLQRFHHLRRKKLDRKKAVAALR